MGHNTLTMIFMMLWYDISFTRNPILDSILFQRRHIFSMEKNLHYLAKLLLVSSFHFKGENISQFDTTKIESNPKVSEDFHF